MYDLVLVTNENGVAMTSSLKIAEVFGKEHKVVLRNIREKLHLFGRNNFAPSSYVNEQNKNRR